MNKFLLSLFALLILSGNSWAAILVFSPNGTYTTKTTLEAARTAGDAANKTIVVTSALTQAQSNITAAWPADRVLRREKGGLIANSTTFDLSVASVDFTGNYQVFTGAGAVTGLRGEYPAAIFGMSTAASDNSAAFQRALNSGAHIKFLPGAYNFTAGVIIEQRGAVIRGSGNQTSASNTHTVLNYTGSGVFIQLGLQNHTLGEYQTPGLYYDGPQGLLIEDIDIRNNTDTSYVPGSYGIKDWAGGSVILNRVTLKRFEYGFWGIKSDFNSFNSCVIANNYIGVQLEIGSDQFRMNGGVMELNSYDTVINSGDTQWDGVSFVGGGVAGECPIIVNGLSSVDHPNSHKFIGCWFENYQGVYGVESFIETGKLWSTRGVSIISPIILEHTEADQLALTPDGPYTANLLTIYNGSNVSISNPSSEGINYLVKFRGTDAEVAIKASDTQRPVIDWFQDASSGGNVKPIMDISNAGQQAFINSLGRMYLSTSDAAVDKSLYLSSAEAKTLRVLYPLLADDNPARLSVAKRFVTGGQSNPNTPATQTWDAGDLYTYTNPVAGGYIGQVCTTGGTQGTYSEGRTATTDGTTTVILSGTTTVLKAGQYLTIGGYNRTVVSVTGTTLVVNSLIVTGSGQAISFTPAVFKPFGAIAP